MIDELERGYDAYQRHAWRDAYDLLSAADNVAALAAKDLGREADALTVLERAHHAYVEANQRPRAARCAFWMGLFLLLRGETGRATGWLARAQRLVDRESSDSAERGYLLLATAEQ